MTARVLSWLYNQLIPVFLINSLGVLKISLYLAIPTIVWTHLNMTTGSFEQHSQS